MSTTQGPRPSWLDRRKITSPDRPRRFRWTTRQLFRLERLGFFRERRVELINGEIIELSPPKPPHCVSLELTDKEVQRAFGAGYYVRSQGALDLGRTYMPQPDLAVVPGNPRDYKDAHPTTALLVVEISDTSLRYDRVRKAHTYARARIADYWILNLVDRQLEIRRNPGRAPDRKGRWTYHDVTIIPADGQATPLAAPQARIAVADLLP